ncbi:hypothetical protein B0H16DRAFT_1629921 [Mycena metata]|uniref:Transmembrane protein n=1 Tax=Mycena metata TaxID=1033252 RepID=A0AAD7MCN8_9AGAR|nr:hypothetical protein B0H16DRAFT_1629921 [Mycena metata]
MGSLVWRRAFSLLPHKVGLCCAFFFAFSSWFFFLCFALSFRFLVSVPLPSSFIYFLSFARFEKRGMGTERARG